MSRKFSEFFFENSTYEQYNLMKYQFYRLKTFIIYKKYFKKMGKKVCVEKPTKLMNLDCFEFDNNVHIWKNSRIEGIKKYNNQIFNPILILQSNVTIQQNVHITCANKIYIGENTAIAANVTITDINHIYTDINMPIESQDIEVNPVIIGPDCKVYNNVVILPGTKIGNHCIIGANSVVNGIFEDYCVIAGIPAKIVKKYNFSTQKWEKYSSK